MTDAADDPDVTAAIEGELTLLDPSVRRDPARVAALLDPDFVEVGRSGRRWTRDTITAALAREPDSDSPAAAVSELRGVRLATDVVHVTYISERAGRRTHRSSLWRRRADGWRVYYHQGTPAAE